MAPFNKFNFRPVSLSIYQLGNVGTAQRKLVGWPPIQMKRQQTAFNKLKEMSPSRTLPLFDPAHQPASWNERMAPGEYAIHYSSSEQDGPGPICTVVSSLPEAEAHADTHIQLHPNQRCRIYDHTGFIGAPIRELKGAQYQGDRDLSPRFRRWTGSILFFGGLALTAFDWSTDFRLSWPGLIGSRLIIPGLILLVTEAVIVLLARRSHKGAHARP
jgi:hypothetical protein